MYQYRLRILFLCCVFLSMESYFLKVSKSACAEYCLIYITVYQSVFINTRSGDTIFSISIPDMKFGCLQWKTLNIDVYIA